MIKVYFNKTINPIWTSHDFIIELALFLKDNFNAELHIGYGWQKGKDAAVKIKEFDCVVPDCEIIIHDDKEDSFKIISFSEIRTDSWGKILVPRNNKNDLLLAVHGQANWGFPEILKSNDFNFTIEDSILFTFDPKCDYSFYYRQRRLLPFDQDFTDKMYFRSTTGRGDEVELQKHPLVNDRVRPMSLDDYLKEIIKYKVGLSLPGGGYEICHRDIEYMAIGLPKMRLEYVHSYQPELIPNVHYVSIDRSPDMQRHQRNDAQGGKKYRDLYIEKFKEIKDDSKLLNFISENARDYYVKNISPTARLKNILKKLKYEQPNT